MPSKDHKHYVKAPTPGALTRAQAEEMAAQLFDAITAERLLSEVPGETGEDDDPPRVTGP